MDLLKPYYYQQIHIDKTSQSCKAVLLNGEAATRCINDLHLKPFKGTNLNVSLASCDFMLCITQLPLLYTLEQFQTLITPFGTAERCFLVHRFVSYYFFVLGICQYHYNNDKCIFLKNYSSIDWYLV